MANGKCHIAHEPNIIEILKDVVGEPCFMETVEADYDNMSVGELKKELLKRDHENAADIYIEGLISKKDVVVQQTSQISSLVSCKGWNPLLVLSKNLKSLAEDIEKYVTFEKEFDPNIQEDERR